MVAAAAVAVAVVAALLPSCGSVHQHQPTVSRDGKAVIKDVLVDGRLDRNWSCASLRAAVLLLPSVPGAYQTIPLMIDEAAGRA